MAATRKPKKVFVQFAIAFVVALVLGGMAVFFGISIISGVSKSAEEAKKQAARLEAEAQAERERLETMRRELSNRKMSYKIVQATADIVPGQPITQNMVTVLSTTDKPPTGATSMLSQVVGRMVKSPVYTGETIEASKLMDTSGLMNVPEGMRAITIPVDTIGGLNGSIAPGSRVDVLTSIENDDKVVTRTMLQNIQVIGVGDGFMSSSSGVNPTGRPGRAPASGKSSGVTLAVTPAQAEQLTLANQLGSFHLTLRNFADKKTNRLSGADLTSLMTDVNPDSRQKTLPKQPTAPASASGVGASGFHNVNYTPDGATLPEPVQAGSTQPKFTMQIYRGTGTETVDFQP